MLPTFAFKADFDIEHIIVILIGNCPALLTVCHLVREKGSMMRVKLFLFTAMALAVSCSAQTASYGHNDKYLLPDRGLTPGAVNPAIVGDPSGKSIVVNGVEANICAKDFTANPYKKATEAVKHRVCDEYGQKDCFKTDRGGFDHLVPLEIGGADTINNLWWLPDPDYDVKLYKVNERLKPLVCSGKINLKTAQSIVLHNWVNGMWSIEILEKCDKCTVRVAPEIKGPLSK